MDIGFETIGNATLICHDRVPQLVTDPWIKGDAYFGSWTTSHEIPARQMDAIKACKFVWLSHGHPDHLSSESLVELLGKTILLPDHVGGRIKKSLIELGHTVQVLPDRTWTPISDHIRILCIADYNQDAILLVDVGGRLVVNLNDAVDHGWSRFIKNEIKRYDRTFLMMLLAFGDADMIHFVDENGNRIEPTSLRRKREGFLIGQDVARWMRIYGTRYFVPFSTMHRYQRADSVWAAEVVTELDDFRRGFESKTGELLPAYIRYDCGTDRFEEIAPPAREIRLRSPEEFGDNWSENLSAADVEKARRYFQSIAHLLDCFDFINLRVGGRDNVIELAGKKFNRGITFEAPRHSLMVSIEYEIFDDMLIGNFMKTRLHGKFNLSHPDIALYPDFSPFVGKYADNGLAKSREEMEAYFEAYRKRAPIDYFRHRLEVKTTNILRNFIHADSKLFQVARGAYFKLKEI